MGFFDFLRKKKTKEKIKNELSLGEIETRISEEEKDLRDKSLKVEERAKSLIRGLIPKLEKSIISLRLINLEKRKEDETLKGIVKENVNLYSSQLENFIRLLERAEEETDSNNYITRIGLILENFSKRSYKSYQRATILVGSEFEEIQNEFKRFFQEFKQVIREDFENKKKFEKLSEFTSNLQKISENIKFEEQIKNIVLNLDAEKRQKDTDIVKKEEEMKNLRESKDYKNDLEERKRVREEFEIIENYIQMLHKKIDLKDLAKLYHKNEQKHAIIKNFIRDFKEAMEKDERIEFAKIVKEARGLDVDFEEIITKRKRLINYANQSEVTIGEIEREIERIKDELHEIENNKKRKEKKLESFKKEKEDFVNELKSKAEEYFLVL